MKKSIYVMLMAAALIGTLTGCGGKKDVAYQSNSSALDNFDFEIEETEEMGVGEGAEYGVESPDFYDDEPDIEDETEQETETFANAEDVERYTDEGVTLEEFGDRYGFKEYGGTYAVKKGELFYPIGSSRYYYDLTRGGDDHKKPWVYGWGDKMIIPTLSLSQGDELVIISNESEYDATRYGYSASKIINEYYCIPMRLATIMTYSGKYIETFGGAPDALEYGSVVECSDDFVPNTFKDKFDGKKMEEIEINGEPIENYANPEAYDVITGEKGEIYTVGIYEGTQYVEYEFACNENLYVTEEEFSVLPERTKNGYFKFDTSAFEPGCRYIFARALIDVVE